MIQRWRNSRRTERREREESGKGEGRIGTWRDAWMDAKKGTWFFP